MSEFIDFDEETQRLIDLGLEALGKSSAEMQEVWGFGRTERWDADTETGILTFTSPGLLAVAPMQQIGSYISAENSWMWAWGNPDVNRIFARHAILVRKYGDQRDLGYLYTPVIYCSEADAWALTALAFQLSGARGGAYRGPSGHLALFMTFEEPAIHRGALS